MKKFVLLLIFLSLFSFFIYSKDDNVEIKRSEPSSFALSSNGDNKGKIIKEDKSKSSGITLQNTLEAFEVRKKYIEPILEKIFSHPVNCNKLQDDEDTFNQLKSIYQLDEPITKFIDFSFESLYREEILDKISPELERQIQERTEGHICFSHPTRSTIKELVDVWEKKPCTKAAATSLLKISNVLTAGILSSTFINGKHAPSFNEEVTRINIYTMENYANSWQGEKARLRESIRNYDINSEEIMQAWKRWIGFVDTNNVLENKYYRFFMGSSNVTRLYLSADYGQLTRIYLHRCDKAIDKEIKETGRTRIPPESIEMYNKHVELRQRERTKYPKYYREMSKLPRCYEMIRDHSPEHYKGDSPEPKKK